MSFENRMTHSSDGVRIAYSVSGMAEVALLLIHGGLADRTFWDGQHSALSEQFRVIALDLAEHGDSGSNRQEWGILPFAHDVTAVIEAEKLQSVVLVGNSLGGTVGIEAALLARERALGVVGVDTFHDLGRRIDPTWAREQAEAWRRDFGGALAQMLRALFHSDADPSLVARVRRGMSKMSVETVSAMFLSLAGYDTGASARQLRIPVRCINGDLFPTNTPASRKVVSDFDAVVLPHTGHFPMLENPGEFDCKLAHFAAAFHPFQSREAPGLKTA